MTDSDGARDAMGREAAFRELLHDLRNHLMPLQLRLDVARRLAGASTASASTPSLANVLESMHATMRDVSAVVRSMEAMLNDAEQRPVPVLLKDQSAPTVSSLRLLIVDDNRAMADALAELVVADGRFSTVQQASTAAEARALIAAVRYDLVLLDVHLADGDGVQLCEELMTEDASRRVAVMSGRVDAALAKDAQKSGALDFIAKGADLQGIVGQLVVLATGRPKSELT